MRPRHVAWASDRRYLRHTAASVASVLTVDDEVTAHLFVAQDVRRNDVRKLERVSRRFGGRLAMHHISDELVDGLPSVPGISAVMWVRVHLPALLNDVDRVVYLDADTIVVDSISELFEIDLGRAELAAVDNVTDPGARDFVAELALPADQRYFNSGVLVMDLAHMRDADATSRVLRNARATRWPDQDALNIVFGQRRHRLHPRWNAQNSLFFWQELADEVFGSQADEARDHPAILHFEGHGPGTKPWDDRCEHPLRAAYLEHARSLPWFLAPDPVKRIRRRARRLLG